MKMLLASVLILLVMLPMTAFAQETDTQAPALDTQPIVIQDSVSVLDWIISLLLVWGVWSMGVSVSFERVKEVALSRILTLLGNGADMKPIRSIIVIAAVFIAAWLTVQEGGLNIFSTAPEWITLNSDFEQGITALFLASGAFLWHNIGNIGEVINANLILSYVQRLKN